MVWDTARTTETVDGALPTSPLSSLLSSTTINTDLVLTSTLTTLDRLMIERLGGMDGRRTWSTNLKVGRQRVEPVA